MSHFQTILHHLKQTIEHNFDLVPPNLQDAWMDLKMSIEDIEVKYESLPETKITSGAMIEVPITKPLEGTFEVQTQFIYGWENVWTEGDGTPSYFETREEAQAAIDDFFIELAEDEMEDYYDREDYRVVEVEK